MSIEFKCPACGNSMTVGDALVGVSVSCPGCRRKSNVPSPVREKLPEKPLRAEQPKGLVPTEKSSATQSVPFVPAAPATPTIPAKLTSPVVPATTPATSAPVVAQLVPVAPATQAAPQTATYYSNSPTSTLPYPTNPNVYRDGEYLVVPFDGARFPARCIKTNQPVPAADFSLSCDILWGQMGESDGQWAARKGAGFLLGSAGSGMVELLNKQRLELKVGLSDHLRSLSQLRSRSGIGLLIVGPILSVALGVGAANATEAIYGTASVPLTIMGMAVGVILMIVGVILFAMSSHTLLRVMWSNGMYVWLVGAAPEFLATLPQSPVHWGP